MRSVTEIIDALGGTTAVAAARGLPATTVASWKTRGSIPCVYWPPLVDDARERRVTGVTLQRLVDIHAAKPRVAKRSAA